MSIIIQEVLVNQETVDIVIEGNHIAAIGPEIAKQYLSCTTMTGLTGNNPATTTVIDGHGKAAFPGMVNCHTHAAMSLFRGYGDDLPLQQWLNEKIWPNEKNLDDEIVYWGSRLACLEMIKSGTTCFNDMYFFQDAIARAAKDCGMRAVLAPTCMDFFDNAQAEALKLRCREWEKQLSADTLSAVRREGMLRYALSPHAIYTVSGDTLRWLKAFADEHSLLLHIHLSETRREVEDCIRTHGLRPVQYLQQLGLLSPTTIVAHGLWLNEEEIKLLAAHDVKVVHNPNSNLKLASGHQFRYQELHDAGVTVALGTDGCSSSNNLDMIEAAKTMSLLQKGWREEPTALPAGEALQVATSNGADTLNLNAGRLQAGCLADLFLVDLNHLAFVPNNNTVSNLIYAAHGDCVETTLIDGRIVMQARRVEGEDEIIREARRVVNRLITT